MRKVFPAKVADEDVAYRVRGRTPDDPGQSASVHQLHAVHDWLCRLRQLTKAWIPQAAIRTVLLGAYDASADRRLEVFDSLSFR